MMVWGHACGVAATGVMLQRIVDPELKSRGIEDSGISDLLNRPIIIGLQIIPPLLMSAVPVFGPHLVTWNALALLVLWVSSLMYLSGGVRHSAPVRMIPARIPIPPLYTSEMRSLNKG